MHQPGGNGGYHCGHGQGSNYGVPHGYGPPMIVGVPMMPPKCSRATYIVLALFFGGFGIHNFVAGRVGAGVAQLLITLLTGWLLVPLIVVGLWVIIEMIAVSTDGNGVRMS